MTGPTNHASDSACPAGCLACPCTTAVNVLEAAMFAHGFAVDRDVLTRRHVDSGPGWRCTIELSPTGAAEMSSDKTAEHKEDR